MSHCLDCHQRAKIYLKDNSKVLLYFYDLDYIFKVKSQLTEAKFSLKLDFSFTNW